MSVDWEQVQIALSPVKDYEDLCKRLRNSFSYGFVREKFNLTLPELASYTRMLLGGDAKGRYTEYMAKLDRIIAELEHAGVHDVYDLVECSESRAQLEIFIQQSGMDAGDVVSMLKYLIYWFIPPEKYLSGLVRNDPEISRAIKVLNEIGIRTNLELLQKGITAEGRKSLVKKSKLPEPVISGLVNRADFSRMPWASKATISNIIEAGYGSLKALASADADKLYADFFQYGKSIGKNLKLGNEIENSYRIAKIIPAIVE